MTTRHHAEERSMLDFPVRAAASSGTLVTMALAGIIALSTSCAPARQEASTGGTYDDLLALFDEWRAFESPKFVEGVPDYSARAMAAQRAALPEWQARLAGFDVEGWPVAQQIDWHLVRAEMNGLEFDHRVRRPWERDPAFYVTVYPAQSDVPAHEGPVIHGWIDLWLYDYPLSREDAAELAERLGATPRILEGARVNLTGNARDLWLASLRSFRGQVADLESLGERVGGTSAELDAAIVAAREATEAFVVWLEEEAPSKTGPSGVGKDDYTWYMQNVHLVPYAWEEQVTFMRRELARAHSSLRLEEHRNRDLPELERIGDAEEYDRRLNDAVNRYMEFLDSEEIHTIEEWMDPALRAQMGSFTPAGPDELRNFFQEVNYRDPMVLMTHKHHWIELAYIREKPHPSPIRSAPPLYNIYDNRSEGLATGVEEMMMHAGLYDGFPRSRELVWIMLAQRAARALAGLYLHGHEFTMEEAVEFAGRWTPRGWLPDADLVRFEQQLYLRQPGYGTSYVTGKIQLEELIAEVALERGDAFTVGSFFDDYFRAGVIPHTLVRWEMSGRKDPILMLGGGND
jgi:hypothetical protein